MNVTHIFTFPPRLEREADRRARNQVLDLEIAFDDARADLARLIEHWLEHGDKDDAEIRAANETLDTLTHQLAAACDALAQLVGGRTGDSA